VDRLTWIAEDLLTLARSDSGVLLPRYQATDVSARITRVLERLQADARDKALELRLHTNGPVEAIIDPSLVDQLAWNLVENAVKFTPSGGQVLVSVSRDRVAVVVEVSDTGPGIPQDAVERIFERFFRADQARTHSADVWGTGLGLSIVRAIAEAHGGTVQASNRDEGGAVFRVTIPAHPHEPQ